MRLRRLAFVAILAARPLAAQGGGEAPVPRDSSVRRTVGADLAYQQFDHGLDAWRTLALSASSRNARGSIIGRVNLADRFNTSGSQVEVDAYPRLADGKYLYLNAGVSGSSIFPGQRFGAEYYTNLPDAFEASAGVRVLWFDRTPVTLWTATLGKYTGNYWISLRPFVHQTATGTSSSASLSIRRYGEDADHFVGLRVGAGNSPSDNATPDAITRTRSSSVALTGSRVLGKRHLWTWSLSRDSEGLTATSSRQSWTFSTGIAVRFE